jgi:hypothetical protein
MVAVGSVAVGNMSGDALPEIVVGVPDDTPADDDIDGRGWVAILHLTSEPTLAVVDTTILGQDDPGVPDTAEVEDFFGEQVDLGDIDRDGYADLVVGAPGENRGRGIVSVVHGAAAGWRTSGNYSYSQNTAGIPGSAEPGDFFGSSLSLLDHNSNGRLDLSIGALGENGTGAVTTLRGYSTRFTTSGSRTFTLTTLGYPYPAGANFGASLP